MKKIAGLALAVSLSLATAGCFEFTTKTTGPSDELKALAGNWSSDNIIPAAKSCTDFKWNVTELTGNTAAGSFSATCAGNLKVQGTAQGSLSGSVINWSAQGTATAPDLPACQISLRGTATLKDDVIEVPYTGETCLGSVSGTQILHRR